MSYYTTILIFSLLCFKGSLGSPQTLNELLKMAQNHDDVELEEENDGDQTNLQEDQLSSDTLQNDEFIPTFPESESVSLQASRGGTTYTRWGSRRCPLKTVYSGITAGSYSNTKGGASNYLCMPPLRAVKYSTSLKYRPGKQGYSLLYGTEYENPNNGIDNHNVPCAVCESARSKVLMVPGTYYCPNSWTVEYVGYLMSGHKKAERTSFICVDKKQESLPGSSSNTVSAKLYHVEARCIPDGLRCPPYDRYKELNCVVCTK